MIYLMSLKKWKTDGLPEERETIFLRGEGETSELAPSSDLQKVWESSAKSKKHWEICKQEYGKELQSPRKKALLSLIAAVSEEEQDWNIVCNCESSERCARGILYDILMEEGVDCFVED